MTRIVKKKLKAIAENTKLVYDAGLETGKALSGDSWYDAFWDKYQENGVRSHWNMAFANRGWNDTTYNPKYTIGKISYGNSMFQTSRITDTKQILNVSQIDPQASSNLFGSCTELVTIRGLIVAESNTYTGWFGSCKALKNITFIGTIGNSISFKDSHLLTTGAEGETTNSVQSIIDALLTIKDGVARTLTLHIDVKAKLTAEQRATITTTKGWTLA